MAEKVIDIRGRFAGEISEIDYILTNLENGRVAEISNYGGDGSIAHNVKKLRKELNDLLNKIQYDKDSALEEVDELFSSGK